MYKPKHSAKDKEEMRSDIQICGQKESVKEVDSQGIVLPKVWEKHHPTTWPTIYGSMKQMKVKTTIPHGSLTSANAEFDSSMFRAVELKHCLDEIDNTIKPIPV